MGLLTKEQLQERFKLSREKQAKKKEAEIKKKEAERKKRKAESDKLRNEVKESSIGSSSISLSRKSERN